jgi:hypothetical protein
MSSGFEKCTELGPSAGSGALLMAGYCCGVMSAYDLAVAVFNGPRGILYRRHVNFSEFIRTEVILTPQSNDGVTGEGAGGVSIHSKFSSDVDLLIVLMVLYFGKKVRDVVGQEQAVAGS